MDMRFMSALLLLVQTFPTEAGHYWWTADTCYAQNTVTMKCKCRPNASGPTCYEYEPSRCSVTASSKGRSDEGCLNGQAKEDCAVMTFSDGLYFKPFSQGWVTGAPRGIAVLVFDPASCSIVAAETFDTADTVEPYIRAFRFRDYVYALPTGAVVILMTADDFLYTLGDAAAILLERMGSPQPDWALGYYSSLAMITKKTSSGWCTLAGNYTAAGLGPAEVEMSAEGMMDPECIASWP